MLIKRSDISCVECERGGGSGYVLCCADVTGGDGTQLTHSGGRGGDTLEHI